MATHSSILAWRIPWPEEPDRLWSTGSQRVGHDWATNTLDIYSRFLQQKVVLLFCSHSGSNSGEGNGTPLLCRRACGIGNIR